MVEYYKVEVYPKHPGDFGGCVIGGVTRSKEEEKSLCDEIARQIKRHVNDVGYVYVVDIEEKEE